MNHQEVLSIFKILTAAYPRQIIKPETVEIYRVCLMDLDFDDVRKASLQHIQSNVYFPTVAELRDLAKECRLTRKLSLPTPEQEEDARVRREAIQRVYDNEHLEY
jgi:hypothetical protein